ncbi:hypothetical protein DWB88_13775 (plasmid) [Staphylococcus warneri]|nr:hypothetical protein DWB88_13775 [Staphylococcus warneri]
MKFTKAQKEVLTKGYEEAFKNDELHERVKTDYKEMYEDLAKDILKDNGYPEDVDVQKIKIDIQLKPKGSIDDFVTNLEESEKIDDIDTFTSVSTDSQFYIEDILDNIQMTNVEIEFKADPEEYLNQHPTIEYLSKEMQRLYDESKLKELLLENDLFEREYVEPRAEEEGFESPNVKDLKYHIEDVELKEPYTTLSDRFISSGKVGENGMSVQEFMRQEFYNEVINNRLYEVKIKFDSDPNDE